MKPRRIRIEEMTEKQLEELKDLVYEYTASVPGDIKVCDVIENDIAWVELDAEGNVEGYEFYL
jgi:hypothetical protein